MTYGEIEAKVRTLVNDAEMPHRFKSDDIRGFARTAVLHLRHINPSERYGAKGLLDENVPAPPNAADQVTGEGGEPDVEIRIGRDHEDAVVKYAAYLVYQLDITDTVNMQVAESLRTRAEALMQL